MEQKYNFIEAMWLIEYISLGQNLGRIQGRNCFHFSNGLSCLLAM